MSIALAYVAAVLAALLAVVVISTLLSIAGAPDPFRSFGLPPFMALLVPTIGAFVYLLALIVAAGPALLAAIVTEGLALRHIWLHALLGAAVSAASFTFTMPSVIGFGGRDFADAAVMAGSGFFGGLVYWLVAGRRAGIVGQQPAGK